MNVIWLAGVALALAGAGPENEAVTPEGGSTQFWETPTGAPADVALWKEAIDVGKRVGVERLRSNKMQWEVKQRRYEERLAELAAGEGEKAKAAAELRGVFFQAWSENGKLLNGRWPVDPTRGCQYPAQNLAGVMGESENPKKATRLLIVREEVEDCITRARPAIAQMESSNAAFEKVIARADQILPPVAPVLAPGLKAPPVLAPVPAASAIPPSAPPPGVSAPAPHGHTPATAPATRSP